jgi:aminoglycoside/choline kinase family phosphotransferase
VTLVADVEDLTPEWLSEALRIRVSAIRCDRIGTGQTAATYRLTFDSGSGRSTVVAKVAHGNEPARSRVAGGFRAEVGFYTDLLPTLDVRAPKCRYAAISDDRLRFTLLLEDLAPREPGVQANGCSTAQAESAVRNLTGLHAPRWSDESLLEYRYIRRMDDTTASFLGSIATTAAQTFVGRYAGALSTADVETLTECAAAVSSWAVARPEPFAPLHGDYRLDNLMFGSDEGDVAAVDWQTLVIGPPTRDLAYFLGTSLTTQLRRAEEDRLVRLYHEQLVARGVSGYSYHQCFEDYRLGQIQGPMITMIGAAYATAEPSTASDTMFLAMARRSCAAIRDLRSLSLLS